MSASLEHDDVFFTEDGSINTGTVEVTTEDDINEAVAAVATLNQAMSALCSTKQILEDSIQNGGVHSDAAPAIGLVMQVAENAGIEPATVAAPAMEAFGVTGTRIKATEIALESISETIKNGGKKVLEKILELLKKFQAYFLSFINGERSGTKQAEKKANALKEIEGDVVITVNMDQFFKKNLKEYLAAAKYVKNDSGFKTKVEELIKLLTAPKDENLKKEDYVQQVEKYVDDIYRVIRDGHNQDLETIVVPAAQRPLIKDYLESSYSNAQVISKLLSETIKVTEQKVKDEKADLQIDAQTLNIVKYLVRRVVYLSQPNNVIKSITPVKKTDGTSLENDVPELDDTDFDMESIVQSVKDGAKKIWNTILELIDKLINHFKTSSPIRKRKVEEIERKLKPDSIAHIRTPVTGNDLISAFYFPVNLLEVTIPHLNDFITSVEKVNKHSSATTTSEDIMLATVDKAVDNIGKAISDVVYKNCKQNIDEKAPHIKLEWLKVKELPVTQSDVSKVPGYIKVVEGKTLEVHQLINKVRSLSVQWRESSDIEDPANKVAVHVLRVVALMRTILHMANPTAIIMRVEGPANVSKLATA